jgi:ABC-type sugar transport system substrate-binding protein
MSVLVHGRIKRPRMVALLVAGTMAAAAMAGCSSTGNTGSSAPTKKVELDPSAGADVTDAQLAATLKKAFFANIDPATLNPVTLAAMKQAAEPLSAEQSKLLATCLAKASCETGRGNLTVGLAYDNANPNISIQRAEATAQAIASPQVAKVVYTQADADLSRFTSNFRSMIAQKVDIIIGNWAFASSMGPLLKQAKAAGTKVIAYGQPFPKAIAGDAAAQVLVDVCKAWNDGLTKVIADLGKNKTYGVYTGVPGNAGAAAWEPCAKETLDAAGWKQVVTGFTEWSPQGTQKAAGALLASGKKPDLLLYDYTMEDFLRAYMRAKQQAPALYGGYDSNAAMWTTFKEAEAAGLKPRAYVAPATAWTSRIAVTAGIHAMAGEKLDPVISYPLPSTNLADITDMVTADQLQSAPVPTLLTPDEVKLALKY